MIRLLQITDTHLLGDPTQSFLGINCYDSLSAIIADVLAQPQQPDLITLTGDLSQDTSVASYQTLLTLFARFNCPIYWIAGNHDVFATLQQVLGDSYFLSDKVIELESWRVILLNTLVQGEVGGALANDQLELLKDSLDKPDKKSCLVMLHHQPIKIGCQWLDAIGLENASEFRDIISQLQRVKAVVCGHVHQDFSTKHKTTEYFSTPSTCIQFKPKQKNFALDVLQPGYRWLTLMPDGSFSTQVCRLAGKQFNPDLTISGY